MYLTILWFSLNCLSFFELYVQDYIDSLRMKRLIRLLHLLLEFVFPPFGEIVFSLFVWKD